MIIHVFLLPYMVYTLGFPLYQIIMAQINEIISKQQKKKTQCEAKMHSELRKEWNNIGSKCVQDIVEFFIR